MENVYDIFCGLYVSLMTNTLFLSKPRHVVKIEDTLGMIWIVFEEYV